VTKAARAAVRPFARAVAARVAAAHVAQRREALERRGSEAGARPSVLPASTIAGAARWRAAVPAGGGGRPWVLTGRGGSGCRQPRHSCSVTGARLVD